MPGACHSHHPRSRQTLLWHGPPRSGPAAALMCPRIGCCYLALDTFRHRAQHGTLQGCRVAAALQLHALPFCPQIGLSSSSGVHAPPAGPSQGLVQDSAPQHFGVSACIWCDVATRTCAAEPAAQPPSPQHREKDARAPEQMYPFNGFVLVITARRRVLIVLGLIVAVCWQGSTLFAAVLLTIPQVSVELGLLMFQNLRH